MNDMRYEDLGIAPNMKKDLHPHNMGNTCPLPLSLFLWQSHLTSQHFQLAVYISLIICAPVHIWFENVWEFINL